MAGVLQLSAVSIVAKHREWRSNEGCGQKGIFRTALEPESQSAPHSSEMVYIALLPARLSGCFFTTLPDKTLQHCASLFAAGLFLGEKK